MSRTARLLLVVALAVPAAARTGDPLADARARLAAGPADTGFMAWSGDVAGLADTLSARGRPGDAAWVRERLGIAAFRAGELGAAERLWRRGLAEARRAEDREREAALLNALAIGLTAGGRREASIPVYAEAIAVKRTLADTAGISRTWGNLAGAYAGLNRAPEALAAVDSARHWNALAGNVRGEVAVLGHRVTILNGLGRPGEALPLARRAVDLAGTLDRETRGVARRHLGVTLLDLGRPRAALAVLDSALADDIAAGNHYYALYVLQDRVLALRRLGRTAAALALADSTLPLLADAELGPVRTTVAIQRGGLLAELGRLDEALATLASARGAFEARLDDLQDTASRLGVLPIAGTVYAAQARALADAGRLSEAWRAAADGAGVLMRRRSGEPSPSLAEVQAALGARGAVLVHATDPYLDPLLLFVVTADTLAFVEVGDLPPLVRDARAAVDLMAAGAPDSACAPPLERLGAALAAPLRRWLSGGIRELHLVPPHSLVGLPWDVLPLPDGRVLGDLAPVSLLPHAGLLTAPLPARSGTELVVAVADPDPAPPDAAGHADPRRGAGLGPLPEARREVAAIPARRKEVLAGAAATPTAVRGALRRAPEVLHCATHAVLDVLVPARAALVLAPDDTAAGLLTAAEIAGLPAPTRLVVLSGCRTGVGGAVLGEGALGLSRAFLLAGAPAVVSTLWDVEDGAARDFMGVFYDALAAGETPATALRTARRDLGRAGYPYRDRAAFVLTGTGAMPVAAIGDAPSRRPPVWIVGALVGAAAALALVRRRRVGG